MSRAVNRSLNLLILLIKVIYFNANVYACVIMTSNSSQI